MRNHTTIQHRRGTETEWNIANPVLAFGEIGVEATGAIIRHKVGDGATPWQGLSYAQGTPGDKGDPGRSAYQVAIDGGFVGTEDQWVASLKGPKGDAGDVRFEGISPGITVGTNSVLIGDKTVPTADRLWVKQSVPSNSSADNLLTPGEYWVGYTPSLTLANDWSEGYGSTGYITVHAPTTGTPYPVQERTLGATLAGKPVRKATRALLANNYGWTPWRPETADIEEASTALQAWVSARIPAARSSAYRISAFGDSQTDGGSDGVIWPEEESWPSRLGEKLGAGYTVTNAGFSGATVDEMLLKVGAIPLRVKIPVVVPSNANTVVEPTAQHGLPAAQRVFDMRINGKNVRIIVKNGVWTFYNWTGGSIPAGTYSLDPKDEHRGLDTDAAVVWIGGNDRTYAIRGTDATVADHIVGGTQQLIEWMSPRMKHVMILGMQPRSSEPLGTPNHDLVTEVNERLRMMFPGKFKSVLEYLQTDALADMGMDPTSEDKGDIANGLMPRSLVAADGGHINQTAARAVGEHLVHEYLKAKGWIE